MKDRSALLSTLFVVFIVCIAVVIGVRNKWATLQTSADRPDDTYTAKHTGYYDRRAITGADGQTDFPLDRLNNNSNSSNEIDDDRKGSSSTSTMVVP